MYVCGCTMSMNNDGQCHFKHGLCFEMFWNNRTFACICRFRLWLPKFRQKNQMRELDQSLVRSTELRTGRPVSSSMPSLPQPQGGLLQHSSKQSNVSKLEIKNLKCTEAAINRRLALWALDYLGKIIKLPIYSPLYRYPCSQTDIPSHDLALHYQTTQRRTA